jgi:hypothetical protein
VGSCRPERSCPWPLDLVGRSRLEGVPLHSVAMMTVDSGTSDPDQIGCIPFGDRFCAVRLASDGSDGLIGYFNGGHRSAT